MAPHNSTCEMDFNDGTGCRWRAYVVPAGKKWRFIIERHVTRWERWLTSSRYRDRADCERLVNAWLDVVGEKCRP